MCRQRLLPVTLCLVVICLSECGGQRGSTPGGASTAAVSGTAPQVSYPPTIPAGTQANIVFDSYNLASAGVGKDATQ